MSFQKYFCRLASVIVFTIIFVVSNGNLYGQTEKVEPELSVAGIELGNPLSAKEFLSKYTPRALDGVHLEY